MIVLDTNVVSELMKAEPDVRVQTWLTAITSVPIATTVITVFEIEFGLGQLPEGKRRTDLHSRFERLLDTMKVLSLDHPAALKAGQFRSERKSAGFNVSSADLMIAGIVAATGATLATRNIKDFESLPLHMVNPWASA
ncbi:hypothetical protein ABAC460_10315 [Asticcacaulis sp. AC460]|uniref:type II toxin-antitoxin system VapC family toxin n=1 Tax=Asticcacaulis sp. AC460 TaxID=1282360 RepID=UPI0003C3DBB4|nr:type II toxin-antitoxin system VapC family toxin [Asticcacaulis sp. AC460]ESQ90135.1 hypothetical protein ABAC460_10315 [Asticcacaulis sp. AC460]